MAKEFGETTRLTVAEVFDDEGFLEVLEVDVEGELAWLSPDDVRELRDHLTHLLEGAA